MSAILPDPADSTPQMNNASGYRVRVTKDTLVFSAGHFITFAGGICERLHGHNYRVAVDVVGPLDENHYVVDFIALRDETRTLCDQLDHRMLLPGNSRLIEVVTEGQETTARFGSRRWVFPADECVILPLANTTTELLARWLAGELRAAFTRRHMPLPGQLIVHVEENFGQWATYMEQPVGTAGSL